MIIKCKKWEINRYDRICEGHGCGVGYAKYLRDPKDGSWYLIDKTDHGASTFEQFKQINSILSHPYDLDEFGDRMEKHQGQAGKFVDLKTFNCKDAKP